MCESILVLGRVSILFEPAVYESFGIRCMESVCCISFKFNASRGYLPFLSLSYHLENSLLSGCLPQSIIKLAALSADPFLNGLSSGTYCPISFLHRFRGIVASWYGMPPCMSGCRSSLRLVDTANITSTDHALEIHKQYNTYIQLDSIPLHYLKPSTIVISRINSFCPGRLEKQT